jgi:hypothetical protein
MSKSFFLKKAAALSKINATRPKFFTIEEAKSFLMKKAACETKEVKN